MRLIFIQFAKTLICTSFILLFSCAFIPDRAKSECDGIIRENFKNIPISELKLILNYFDGIVCSRVRFKNHEIDQCYQEYFRKIEIEAEKGLLVTQIEKVELITLLEKIDIKTFNSIWHGKPNSNLLNINTESDYAHFLNSLGKNNTTIKEYTTKLMNVGDISPAMIEFIIINTDKLDMYNECHRLFLAIHYITLTMSD